MHLPHASAAVACHESSSEAEGPHLCGALELQNSRPACTLYSKIQLQMASILAWDVQLNGEQETVLSMQVEHGPPVRLQLASQPGCELLTVTNGANEAGRMLLEAAVLQLQDSFGNCCYVQDVVGSVALEPSNGKAQGTRHKPVLLSAAPELEHNPSKSRLCSQLTSWSWTQARPETSSRCSLHIMMPCGLARSHTALYLHRSRACCSSCASTIDSHLLQHARSTQHVATQG